MVDSARKRRQFGCSTATAAAAASGGAPPPPPSTPREESAMRKMESIWRRGIVRRRGSIMGMGEPIIVNLICVIVLQFPVRLI